jgi:hypothetical protein
VTEGGKLSEVMLHIIAIRHHRCSLAALFCSRAISSIRGLRRGSFKYKRWDLWIGIALVMIGGIAMTGSSAAVSAGKPEFQNYTDALGTALGLEMYAGKLPAILFALALIGGSIIGRGSHLPRHGLRHRGCAFSAASLHRRPHESPGWSCCGPP